MGAQARKEGFLAESRRCRTACSANAAACGALVYEEDARNACYCCPKTLDRVLIEPYTRIRMVTDRGSFQEWDAGLAGEDPLQFPGYAEKVEKLQDSTGLCEAVVTGQAKIAGMKTAIGAMSPDFLMGSMGTAVGEKITRMIERATRERLPVILFLLLRRSQNAGRDFFTDADGKDLPGAQAP